MLSGCRPVDPLGIGVGHRGGRSTQPKQEKTPKPGLGGSGGLVDQIDVSSVFSRTDWVNMFPFTGGHFRNSHSYCHASRTEDCIPVALFVLCCAF